MKSKYLKRPVADEQNVEYLMEKGLSQCAARVLSSRGINRANYDDFVQNKSVTHSPFEMKNMDAAVETISYVMESGGKILIYGDYDTDGLTASSILSLFFTDNGVDNDVIIPSRDDGYGLHAENVFKAFERDFYDLLITVDCGISNAEDINKIINELGVEIIVTDHHELPEILPDCICVNPKMGYPFPYLAGAGVAWKLVEAIAGVDVAVKYTDLACVGTIGDVMPMHDENRTLVKMGLNNFHHKSLCKLAQLANCSANITATDVAMRLSPKINAAGRVGSPLVALSVLLGRDKVETGRINKLLELNEQRKRILDEIVAQSDSMCNLKRISAERMVFLYSDSWPHGLLGIVASRYKERFKLPAVIMTLDGDNYVGSARGIDSVNLFEIFSGCKDCLVKFGGHKASVGFSVEKDRVEELRKRLASAFVALDAELFETRLYYDVDLGIDCDEDEVLKLTESLQPMLPQDKIICRVSGIVKFANQFGKDQPVHMSATMANGLELKGFFKYAQYVPFIRKGANIDAICSLDIDGYNHKTEGILEDINLENSVCFDEFYRLNLIKNFSVCDRAFAEEKDIATMLKADSIAAVFDDYETFLDYTSKYDFSDFSVDIFFDGGQRKAVVISPLDDYCFGRFDTVVYFAQKDIHRNINAVYVHVSPARAELYAEEMSRDICTLAYSSLRKKAPFDSIKNVFDKYLTGKMRYEQYLLAIRVFEELGLIKVVDKYNITFDSSTKRALEDSKIFEMFRSKR